MGKSEIQVLAGAYDRISAYYNARGPRLKKKIIYICIHTHTRLFVITQYLQSPRACLHLNLKEHAAGSVNVELSRNRLPLATLSPMQEI